MGVLCSIKNLSLSFGHKNLFEDADFQIDHGDRVGLIGLNGMGKSSLFKILCERLTPDTNPNYCFDKASSKMGPEYEYSVFLIEQEFRVPEYECSITNYVFEYYPDLKVIHDEYNMLISDSSEKALKKLESVMNQMDNLNYWEFINQYESYLRSFDLVNLERDVKSLSGGEQKKILLCLGLISPANLILWDEPTNHLDLETIEKLEDELLACNKTYMIISHDRHLLSKVCNRIVTVDNGKIKTFKGSYPEYLIHLDVKEEQRLKSLQKLQNTLKRETEWMRQGVKARGTRSKKRVEGFENLSGKVAQVKSEARKKMSLAINDSGRKSKKLASFEDVSLSFGDKTLFSNIDIEFFKGDKIGILGPNGAGKSSFVKLLAGRTQPTSGTVRQADGLLVGYFDQKREDVDLEKTPFELIGNGEDFVHFRDGTNIHVNSYFQKFLFHKDQLHRPMSSFSGGEINRLQLCLNLKNESDIWIFDEPTNDLDIESIEILEDALAKFDGTVFIISHDRSFLDNVTNKIIVLEEGRFETFNAGFAQVSDYLDALKLERELNLNTRPVEVCTPVEPVVKAGRKLSNKEKQLLKKLPSLIKDAEARLASIDKELTSFDYTRIDEEASKGLADLNNKKEEVEMELLELYELNDV